ncbi:MAG: 5-formyltetrahydrofolate cyclo-ligase [Planctomycetales bacterium]|nr:5-formyltetrahydrofolate cyclo-ligase [Planctomycetales bacterium]
MRSKHEIRAAAKQARADLSEKEGRSHAVFKRVSALSVFANADRIAFYVDVRDEVRTQEALTAELRSGNREISLPYCDGDDLRLVRLDSFDELAVGRFGILEPNDRLKQDLERSVMISTIDAILVPGVAFDREGNRLGYGAGFYDRLLANSDVTKIGLAYECQVFDCIQAERFDIQMDYVCTEVATIECRS